MPYDRAFRASLSMLPQAASLIAHELRQMATGDGPYTQLDSVTPEVRNIWLAAAELIEPQTQALPRLDS